MRVLDWVRRRTASGGSQMPSAHPHMAGGDAPAALARVGSPSLLSRVASDARDPFIARAAVKSLGDEDALVELALTCRDGVVARLAARRIRGAAALARVATDAARVDVRREAA